jgi:hypothetical protein
MTQSVLSSTWWIGWQVKRGTCAGMTLLVPWLSWRFERKSLKWSR